MTDKPQEPRDLIQICTDIYYECGTIKHLDELTDEALDWHNKQIYEARLNEAQNAYEYWINGRKFISSYFRDRIAELSQTLKEHKEK